jgi:methyl-accepting chemotaxis protein
LSAQDLANTAPDLAAKLASFSDALSGLANLRDEVSARSGVPADLSARFTATIAAGIDAVSAVERDGVALDGDVGRSIATYGALGRGKEQAGRERATGLNVLSAGAVTPDAAMKISMLAGAQEADFAAVPRMILPQHEQGWNELLSSPANRQFVDMRKAVLAAIGATSPVTVKQWFDAASARMDAMRDLQSKIAADTGTMAENLEARSRSGLTWDALAALLATLGALVAAWLAGRSITRPLHVLTSDMSALAAGDKTVAVKAASRSDEIGEMGRAVLVFRNAAVELERAEAEQARIEAEAAAERRRNEQERAARAAELQRVVDELASGLKTLSDGDLTARVESAFAPDFEQLRSDFNMAMGKLQAAMQAVTGSAGGIHIGADEISRAADDQSRRSEQQAASLEETAAALDQITATVRKTAEGANQANQVVGSARSDAERSGHIVRDAVTAMSEIERSSKQISQIIGVIEEIAFQTNLLALNAGVEAARAGEAGRGFMVVATEVRALAQRSSDAAKEIKTLISASSRQVEHGVHLVGETGQALQQIVDRVVEINTLVAHIAQAAHEQAAGLAQINTAVNQMDQVTQQNAAMAEETTAASQSLTKEAKVLAGLIARFRTGETTDNRDRHATGRSRGMVIAAE